MSVVLGLTFWYLHYRRISDFKLAPPLAALVGWDVMLSFQSFTWRWTPLFFHKGSLDALWGKVCDSPIENTEIMFPDKFESRQWTEMMSESTSKIFMKHLQNSLRRNIL